MRRNKSFRFWILTVLIGFALPASAAELPKARPEIVGLSSARLEGAARSSRGTSTRAGSAARWRSSPGAARSPISRLSARIDPATGAPMPADAIFRIASQTKAVTSVAVMILFEEGRILLGDPVSKYIPEFAKTTVAVPEVPKKGLGYKIVPAKAADHRSRSSDPLLRHLLRRWPGQGPLQGGGPPGLVPGRPARARRRVHEEAGRAALRRPAWGEVRLWLQHRYPRLSRRGHSGMSLADFVAERITGPLAMADTSFFLPEEKAGRFAAVCGIGRDGKAGPIDNPREMAYLKGPRTCYAGGAGLLSTAEDYARFLLMLQSGGEWGGVHILSPKSVALMTVDHLGPVYASPGQGFGLGFWVTKELGRNGDPGSVGAFGWGGAYHTTYWVDPAEKLVAVFMTQLMPATGSDAHAKFKALVYQSIVESYDRR